MSIPYDSIVFASVRFYSVLFCYETVVYTLFWAHLRTLFDRKMQGSLWSRNRDVPSAGKALAKQQGKRFVSGDGRLWTSRSFVAVRDCGWNAHPNKR